ncbi:hypothetical protein ACQY0O_002263 [Thecaphora frezii]
MSLSDLVSGGAGCGPSNPLQSIGKRFGQDRSTQMDTFSNVDPSSSSLSSFRQQQHHQQQQQTPGFFHATSSLSHPPHTHGPDAFDVSQLRGNLPFASLQPSTASFRQPSHASRADLEASFPSATPHATTTPLQAAAPPAWAADFLKMGAAPALHVSQQQSHQQQPLSHTPQGYQQHEPSMQHPVHVPPGIGMGMGLRMGVGMGMGMGMSAYGGSGMQHMGIHSPMADTQAAASSSKSTDPALASIEQGKWNDAFTAYEVSRTKTPPPALAAAVEPQAVNQAEATSNSGVQDHSDSYERDELARTAGRLVSSVEHDQSAKFKQSNFLDLMRRIRDKQAGIQGTDIVENGPAAATATGKGKAREVDAGSLETSQQRPQSQQQAYEWASQMALQGRASQLPPSIQKTLGQVSSSGPLHRAGTQPMIPPILSAEQEIANRQALNELWAEEDARSEAIERQAMEEQTRAFVGDSGDVTARMREDDAEAREFEKYQRLGAQIPHDRAFDRQWEEDLSRAAVESDEEDFVGKRWEGTKGRGVNGAQAAEWDKLQADWDNFEVTSAGIRPAATAATANDQQQKAPLSARSAPEYRFLASNPYLDSTRHHAAHAQHLPASLESVLEREAAVASDPTNAALWYDLGVKQQENERESQAIAALQKAISLDPSLKDAWLALAVSYTNENDRPAAYEAIERWIETNNRYTEVVRAHCASMQPSLSSQQQQEGASTRLHDRLDSGLSQASSTSSLYDRHEQLTSLLIALARSSPDEIDADVQVALGVLFNSSEDYAKAVDCFASALQVRPQDWLLYNRLGATLSNSGRSDEAIRYYHHALELQPGFVRCHFNLSISCLNLKMYQDAATHIYTALTLQQAEQETLDSTAFGGGGGQQSSVASGSLWETFRVALELLNRPDLAAKCARRDINAFHFADIVPPSTGF